MATFIPSGQDINVKKVENDVFLVKSHSSNNEYSVNLRTGSCTCLHYVMRLAKSGGRCKHFNDVVKYLENVTTNNKSLFDEVINLIKLNPKNIIEWEVLSEKFGDQTINEMLNLGMIYKKSNHELGVLE